MNKEKKPARRPRLEERKPIAVTQAMRVYAETGSIENAAEVAGCHVRTIRRLIERDAGFCQVKKALAERAFELSAAAQEVALERVGELSAMQAAVAAKLSAQSGLELSQQQSAGHFTLSEFGEAISALDSLLALQERFASQQGAALDADGGKGDSV
jgi:hypothetical protein